MLRIVCLLAAVFSNIGYLEAQQINAAHQDEITTYLKKAEEAKQEGDKVQEADNYNKIARIYWDYQRNAEAIDYYTQSLALNKSIGNNNAIRVISKYLSLIYTDISNYDKALEYLQTSLQLNRSFAKKADEVADLIAMGAIYSYQQLFEQSIDITKKALEMAKELNDINLIKNCYSQLGEVYKSAGMPDKSMQYYEEYSSLVKHIQMQELTELQSQTNQAKAEIQAKRQELESAKEQVQEAHHQIDEVTQEKVAVEEENLNLARENELKEAQIKANRYIMFILAGGAVFIFVVAFLVYVQLRNKKKANALLKKQHDEINKQKQEIEKQHDIVNHQKKKITDSIMYARRIQQAVLPPTEYINKFAEDYFILFKPRDIVSGDFYWFNRKENVIIMAAADCTGHGVPGAFMSMLGVAFLNEIVNKIAINKHLNALQTDEILNQLRENVIQSLHQSGDRAEPKDGMDIALCIIDLENMKLQFSGAHNPLYIVRNGELIQYNGDKMPVSWHERYNVPFTRHDIDLQANDLLYVFSDGFIDQFGGPKGRKFLSKNFKNLILEIEKQSMADQKVILDQKIEDWKGDKNQLDDILVIGFKVPKKLKEVKEDKPFYWPNKKVLIAEDTDINFFLLVEALRPSEVIITRAEDGAEAVELTKNNDYDLILMDINMPNMDGNEATKVIKQNKPQIPIVVQTAAYSSDEAGKSLEAGADDFVSKPIDLKSFLEKLAKYLN